MATKKSPAKKVTTKKAPTVESLQKELSDLKDDTDRRIKELASAFINVENSLLGHMNGLITKIGCIFHLLKNKTPITMANIDEALRRQADITNQLLKLQANKTLAMPTKVAMYFAWAKQKEYEVFADDLNAKKWLFSAASESLVQEERLKLAHEWGFNSDIGFFFKKEEETTTKEKKPAKK